VCEPGAEVVVEDLVLDPELLDEVWAKLGPYAGDEVLADDLMLSLVEELVEVSDVDQVGIDLSIVSP
jgi:hypothetical protein